MKRFLGQAVDPNPVAELDRYILEGGFPEALGYPRMADKRAYVGSVIREIFKRDIRRRVKVKNVSVFNRVRDYVINNFGATTSLTNILSDLERQGVRTTCLTFFERELRSGASVKVSAKPGWFVWLVLWKTGSAWRRRGRSPSGSGTST